MSILIHVGMRVLVSNNRYYCIPTETVALRVVHRFRKETIDEILSGGIPNKDRING